MTNNNNNIDNDKPATIGQYKLMCAGITMLVLMNIAMSIIGLIIGLQVKTKVDGIEEQLQPIMELAQELEAMGIIGGDDTGGNTMFIDPNTMPDTSQMMQMDPTSANNNDGDTTTTNSGGGFAPPQPPQP